MELVGKNVLVTGSSRGIGLAIARRFKALGANVILHSRNGIKADILGEFGGQNALTIQADLSDESQVATALSELYTQIEQIDVLVNNAGITNDTLAVRMSPADFAQVVNTNLNGTFNVTQPIFKQMMKKRSGNIINISSVVGLMGNMGQANYAASKAGVIGLTKSLAKEGARRGVRVNAIAPGMIVSDMTDALNESVQAEILKNIPLGRFGNSEEIAQTAEFIAQNDYITGQTITVDGGLYI